MNLRQDLWDNGWASWTCVSQTPCVIQHSSGAIFQARLDRNMLVFANDHGMLVRFETENDDHLAALQARLGYRTLFETAQRAFKALVIQSQAPAGEWYWSLQGDGYFRQLQERQVLQHSALHQIFLMLWAVAVMPVQRRHELCFNFLKPLCPRDALFFQVPTSAHEKLRLVASYQDDLAVLQAALHTDIAKNALARFISL